MLSLNFTDLIPVATVPDHLPRKANGILYDKSTCSTWALYGLRGNKLATCKLGLNQA